MVFATLHATAFWAMVALLSGALAGFDAGAHNNIAIYWGI